MPQLIIEDFRRGIDRRRTRMTSLPGSLYTLNNAHITRGGEIEKRKAFVAYGSTNISQTFGLHAAPAGLYVFGSAAAPSMPTGITYQRLQSSGGLSMTGIDFTCNYNGKIYAIARFSGNVVEHFYNGTRVTDWDTITAAIASNDTLAAAFRTLIGLSDNYVVTGATNAIIVEGEEDKNWKAKLKATNGGTVDDQAFGVATTTPFVAGGKKKKTFTVLGTFEAADWWSIKLIQPDGERERWLLRGQAGVIGTTALVHDGKIYSTAQSLLYFSEINGPRHWYTQTNGAGFIDMSNETQGSEVITALALYQGHLAVFARRTIQIWDTDPDPANNRKLQVLRDTGTFAPRSVAQFGDLDVFYLDDTGVRSLRARDSSNSATVSDIGVAIDPLISEDYPLLSSETVRSNAVAIFEPQDGRYWLAIGSKVYVFSYFPGTKIEAWSTYTATESANQTAFSVTALAQYAGLVYARGSDDVIYAYGGTGGTTYDATVAEVVLPLLDAGKPGNVKHAKGIDITAEGDWNIYFGMDSTAPDAREGVAEPVDESTWDQQRIEVSGEGTRFNIKLTSDSSGRCVLGSLAVHYDLADAG